MGQEQPVEFLSHQTRFLTTQRLATQAQMVCWLIDADFDVPALMIAVDELEGRRLQRVERGGHQAMQLTGIGVVARLRSRKLGESLGGVWLDTILDHAHLHWWEADRMQGDQIAAIGENLRSRGELVGLQARQGLSLALMDQRYSALRLRQCRDPSSRACPAAPRGRAAGERGVARPPDTERTRHRRWHGCPPLPGTRSTPAERDSGVLRCSASPKRRHWRTDQPPHPADHRWPSAAGRVVCPLWSAPLPLGGKRAGTDGA